MKKSKKFLVAIIAIIVVIVLAMFLSPSENKDLKDDADTISGEIKQTDTLTLDAIVVDDSYRNKDNSSLRAVYTFFTIKPESNIKFTSKFDAIVNGTNTYTSEVLPLSLCKYAPNYSYSGYLENGYVGETKKMVATFLIPEGDLLEGKEIRFSDDHIEDMNELSVSTNSIIYVSSDKEACKIADPEGCAKKEKAYTDASTERANKVKSLINGYYWECYVNSTKYKVEFSAPNTFVVTTSIVENGGSYSIKNNFIFCTYDSNGTTIEIPYELENGDISIDLVEAFDVK